MAIQREMSITLKLSGGDTIDLTGDAAQNALQAYQAHALGGIANALKITNVDGNEEYVEFKCLCGLEIKETTETEIPDTECEQIGCIPDYTG